MRRLLFLALFAMAFGSPGRAAQPNTEVKLLLSHSAARPGEMVTAALQMVSQPGWHTYWQNPGDAGLPATIEWQLPEGLSPGGFQFPVPEKLVIAKLFAYVYEGEVLLLIPITVSSNIPPGNLPLKGVVSWLECSEKTCLPQETTVTATVVIGDQNVASADAPLIEKWRGRLPQDGSSLAVSATWENPTATNARPLLLEWSPQTVVEQPDFFPLASETYSLQGATEVLEATSNKVRIRKTVQLNDGSWPESIAGLILNHSGKDQHLAYGVNLKPAGGSITAPAGVVQLGGDDKNRSILAILGLAFLGGLILNIMPCVLPVIALKILGFVNQSREEPARVRQLGIVYMLGVLASFLVLAGVIISIKNATGGANWGFQMQNPYFVVGMTVLVTLVALNLFGIFEITLASGALGTASGLASREGAMGAFYNGILATLLATPCTAPALGAAVGAVITQPAHMIILTFLTVGFGLALPYVLLSWNPKWLKFLPKPGNWMEKFKMAMGFPMLATAVWLLSIAARHFGKSGFLWLGLFLVSLSLAAWIWGDFVQRGARHRTLAMALSIFILLGGYAYALESRLQWRSPRQAQSDSSGIEIEPGGIPWRKWTPSAVLEARAAGHPVLVDFTADWCLTCQLNKSSSLEIESVKQKLKQIDAVPILADFTLKDPEIGKEIRRFNRAGVPLVIVFPADTNAAPILLPEILTPGIVLEALDLAVKKPT